MRPSERLADKARFVRWAYAVDASNKPVPPFWRSAVRWDITGAMILYPGLPLALQAARLRSGALFRAWQEEHSHDLWRVGLGIDDFSSVAYHAYIIDALREVDL